MKPSFGGKTYKIHLPPNIPAKAFWSFVIYDNQTRSMLQTDEQFPSIGSENKDIVINPIHRWTSGWPDRSGGSRSELGADRARQRVEQAHSVLRTAPAVVRQNVETGRVRAGDVRARIGCNGGIDAVGCRNWRVFTIPALRMVTYPAGAILCSRLQHNGPSAIVDAWFGRFRPLRGIYRNPFAGTHVGYV